MIIHIYMLHEGKVVQIGFLYVNDTNTLQTKQTALERMYSVLGKDSQIQFVQASMN